MLFSVVKCCFVSDSCSHMGPKLTRPVRRERAAETFVDGDGDMNRRAHRTTSFWRRVNLPETLVNGNGNFNRHAHWKTRSRSEDLPEKCYNPNDNTLTFVDGDDDMDFLCIGYKSLRARMSCGHTVTPTSLTDWCLRQLEEGSTRFKCGKCEGEWTYEEVCKMALLTLEEEKDFDSKLFKNAANVHLNVKLCPGCKCLVVRENLNDLCVKCPKCTTNNIKPYKFCWQCLREWKGPIPASERCENEDCCNEQLKTLKNCPVIIFKNVGLLGIKDCPSIRACVFCGKLLEHSGMKCKFVICKRCKTKFCFVCLKLFPECQNYFEICKSGVSPRQTAIPVWDGKIANNANINVEE
ncbi:potential E3 ubiquitin-protein ligase ariadne-2-like isoform X2 [Boleophthalmus pectinirostris]|uniref:potential E3 ubiquitin-protein ligase ariadne-2-like isoform X2 n=2 Tax=Boleophthalmus pectinirostris TaxID=150288 RepID=UPI00242B2494|nr:potential E3 ubiquitin-protein ligase ariadne-2-like isoform X2 [Boleophthalmus pectinirostris]